MATAKKKGFLDGYKTYDPQEGRGSPDQWRGAFNERMGIDEANTILGDDDPLSLLGLTGNPTLRAIKKAYRVLANKWHPDKAPTDSQVEEYADKFKKIAAAFVKLKENKR